MLHDDIANYEKCRVLLEVHSKIEQEGSIVRFVKTVVADVGKADVIGEVGIEHIVADAALLHHYFILADLSDDEVLMILSLSLRFCQ